MSRRFIRLLAAGAVAVLFVTGPVQAQGGPRETGTFWRWLGSVQESAVRVLRLFTGEVAHEKQGLMVDPDGINTSSPGNSTGSGCTGSCPDQGHMIDPDG